MTWPQSPPLSYVDVSRTMHRLIPLPPPFREADNTFAVDPTFLIATLANVIYTVRLAITSHMGSNVNEMLLSVESSLETTLGTYLGSSRDPIFEAAIDIFRENRNAATSSLAILRIANPIEISTSASLVALQSLKHLAEALENAVGEVSTPKFMMRAGPDVEPRYV